MSFPRFFWMVVNVNRIYSYMCVYKCIYTCICHKDVRVGKEVAVEGRGPAVEAGGRLVENHVLGLLCLGKEVDGLVLGSRWGGWVGRWEGGWTAQHRGGE